MRDNEISTRFFKSFVLTSAKGLHIAMIFSLMIVLTSCFTGIESTKKIKLTKSEQKEIAPTAEEKFLSVIKATPDTSWSVGKIFVVVGDRAGLLFEPKRIESGEFNLLPGDTLRYQGAGIVSLPDGNKVRTLSFNRNEDVFRFIPSRSRKNETILSDAMPGVVDAAMLEEAEKLMANMTLWTISPIWESLEGESIDGRKYEKVVIRKLLPGNMVFPARVLFSDEEGVESSMLMSFGSSGNDSRGFANIFRLSDPRTDYPVISDKVWNAVKRGEVFIGMTKDECRLSKGNPKDVNNGRDYQHIIMIWTYSDGMVLYFVDDILRGINTFPKNPNNM